MRQACESLAGRVAHVEMVPVDVSEIVGTDIAVDSLWLCGGFPKRVIASSDRASLAWRRDFLRSYLERDVPMFAPRLPTAAIERLLEMLAHGQGSLLNQATLAASLGVSATAVGRYVDLLVDLLLVRRLRPWSGNLGKRRGAELDLVFERGGRVGLAIETKRSIAPTVSRGFHEACADLDPRAAYVVHGGEHEWPMGRDVTAISLAGLVQRLTTAAASTPPRPAT